MRNLLGDIGLLVLRVTFGATILLAHGQYKIQDFNNLTETFPDPLGIGSSLSLILVIFAEVVCSILIVIGLATRLSSIPLIITMCVAYFLIHADDPWDAKELAILYLYGFSAIFLIGPGRISMDQWLISWRLKKQNDIHSNGLEST